MLVNQHVGLNNQQGGAVEQKVAVLHASLLDSLIDQIEQMINYRRVAIYPIFFPI
jgi:hypothetical protein